MKNRGSRQERKICGYMLSSRENRRRHKLHAVVERSVGMCESIRIKESDYEQQIRYNRMAAENTDEDRRDKEKLMFPDRDMWPSVKQMEAMKVKENMRKYWRLLSFYHADGVYQSNDPGYAPVKKYIDNLFGELVVIVPDDVMERIESIQPGQWKEMGDSAKIKRFKPLIDYYGWNEEASMVRDIGYQKFMKAYGVTEAMYKENKSEKISLIESDLHIIWECAWNDIE